MRKSLVVANWKMNGSLADTHTWVKEFSEMPEVSAEVAVCAPFVYLPALAGDVREKGVKLGIGAENCASFTKGAYTGEVSAAMLSDIGCEWVILGHSERRSLFGENNEQVAEKARLALESGLRPIICVGETLEEQESGRTVEVVKEQLEAVLKVVGAKSLAERGAIAYEPVWAIGTGKTATPQQAELVHAVLRDSVESYDSAAGQSVRILYGGSVKPSNAADLFACNDIDGGLIGGASLKAGEFHAIALAAQSLTETEI